MNPYREKYVELKTNYGQKKSLPRCLIFARSLSVLPSRKPSWFRLMYIRFSGYIGGRFAPAFCGGAIEQLNE